MTKEEAIKYGIEWLKDEYLDAKDGAFIKIALEALKQEPCEDAISRQAVLNILDDMTKDYAKSNDFEKVNGVAWVKVQKLPPVNPQPKTGHWIMSDDGLYRPICDKCGAHPWKGYIPTVEEATEVFKYCPNCGAFCGGDNNG